MKVYIASSWKNEELVSHIASYLRGKEIEVDAFIDDSRGRYVFNWREIVSDKNKMNAPLFLQDERTQRAFNEDKKWLNWCDFCLVILPAGNSTHLEAGYAKGKGKKLIIFSRYFPMGEFDVMYGFADLLTANIYEVKEFIKGRSLEE